MSRFIVAVTFRSQGHFLQKVQNIKYRFSESFSSSEMINLPLIAPFEFSSKDGLEQMDEEIKSFFIDPSEFHFVRFKHLDIYKTRKKYLLYLHPSFSVDFNYCIESLKGLKGEVINSLKNKESKSPYLLLGKFHNEFQVMKAHKDISSEFQFPVEIEVSDISLFRKMEKGWRKEHIFINFENKKKELIINHNDLLAQNYRFT